VLERGLEHADRGIERRQPAIGKPGSLALVFKDFADFFYPNTVEFQDGYRADQVW
jgi:hypothetical protein